MNRKSFLISIIAVLLSFIGGFLIANSINRLELEKLRGENERLKNEKRNGDANDVELSGPEIDSKIAEADRDPNNFQFQKNLGVALYRYGAMKQDADLVERSIRLLDRAAALDKSDREVLVSLGNANFDLGYYRKQNEPLLRARELYGQALKPKPDDIEVRTDLGLTYFLADPPDLDSAISEFRTSLQTRPDHQRTLQFLIQALVKKGDTAAAEAALQKLKSTHPTDESIPGLSSMIERAKPGGR
jgi:tetratricopeptide (TPR) repeat protein